MALKINLETMSWEQLMDLARRAKLSPGAALRAVHNLEERGRSRLTAIMSRSLPAAYGAGPKGLRIRGALVREAKLLRPTDRAAAVAMWTLAAAGLRERHEALAQFAAGLDQPPLELPSSELSVLQLDAVNRAMSQDWDALEALLVGAGIAPRSGVIRETGRAAVLMVTTNEEVAVSLAADTADPADVFRPGGIDEVMLHLSGGRPPIPLPRVFGERVCHLAL